MRRLLPENDALALAMRHAIMPAYLRYRRPAVHRHARELARSQFCSPDEIRDAQWAAARRLIEYAWAHNPFHRRRLDAAGALPGDFRSFDDLARLPLLTKDDLRADPASTVSDEFDPARLGVRRSGGSTGVPVRVFQDDAADDVKLALLLRHDEWAGFRPGARQAALWGDVKPAPTLRGRLADALFKRTFYLDTLEMDDRSMLAFAERIRRTRTRLLFGHGHSLYSFAKFVGERGVHLALDGIISSAEMLPPEERRVVEQVFGNVVFDRYGCEEVALIASECGRREGLHVAAEGLHVEILDGTATEPGRVVVTDLVNRATPLIRYELGDLATTMTGRCACGRGLPRIGRVTGRTSDMLHAPDGRRVSGVSLLDTVLIHIPGFRQVQVVQERLDTLTFFVVKDERYAPASLAALAAGVARYFGPEMRHDVRLVDRIPLTGRGKFQVSVCKLRPEDLRAA